MTVESPAHPKPGLRTRLGACALGLALAVSGCAMPAEPAVGGDPRAAWGSTPAVEQELSPGWDEQPDGPPPTPDADLSADQLAELLRVQATDAASSGTCRASDVELSVAYYDSAAGHRYGRTWVTNTGAQACTLQGYPGIGARGAWGSAFLLDVEQRDTINPAATVREVRLAPGERAYAELEWTGELAGAASEQMSMFVAQLSRGEAPATFIALPDGAGSGGDGALGPIDIGMQTTVRVGAFQAEDRG